MDASSRVSLTIGDLAHRTGVPIATLRSWEKRYGFPEATRQAGGHRRYAESDVDAVLAVLERRRSGLSLAAAVRRGVEPSVRTGSLFAELCRRHPLLRPQALSRGTLVSMSHAIEDECCARAADPVLFGGFQREAFLRSSSRRWSELARTARRTVVFAELGPRPGPSGARDDAVLEVSLPHESPLNREWLVVCDAEDLPACLVAVERPGQGVGQGAGQGSGQGSGQESGSVRTFEAVWSVDPVVVRDASTICESLADDLRPGWRGDLAAVPQAEPVPASDDLRRATRLFDRMLGYLDGPSRREGGDASLG